MSTFNPLRVALLIVSIYSFAACTKNNPDKPLDPVIVTTRAATGITATSALSGGEIGNATGVTDKGIIWGTDSSSLTVSSPNKLSNGGGAANFTDTIKGLQPNTVYFVRAFASAASGVVYGAAISFNTLNSTATVYIAGYHGYSAAYWKDGKLVALPDGSRAHGMYVAGADVYVAGEGYNESGNPAFYWKNGSTNALTDGKRWGVAHSIQVSGNDVHVCGYDYNIDEVSYVIGKYWRNGTEVNLVDTASDLAGIPYSMFISGDDVYLAGYIGHKFSARSAAVYWKNGMPVFLTDTSKLSDAQSIFVKGNDVYVAGSQLTDITIDALKFAYYWKNGTPVALTNGSYQAGAYSVYVSGSDVYVAGYEKNASGFSFAKYWKNGVPVSLSDGTTYGYAYAICVVDGDVYVAGAEGDNTHVWAKFWKNGVSQPLEVTEQFSSGNAIVVQ